MKNYMCAHCKHCNEIKYDGFFCDETGYIESKTFDKGCDKFESDSVDVPWISCGERLPETHVRVLVKTESRKICIAQLMNSGAWMPDGWHEPIIINQVIAWRQLPEVQEDDEQRKH